MNSQIYKKKVILRVDFNVPLVNGVIKDTNRIDAVKPTIDWLLKLKPKRIIIISHLKRPDGIYNKELSLLPIYNYLEKSYDINFINYEKNYVDYFAKIGSQGIYLLDNIRFYKEEKNLDKTFCKYLSALGDVFVNDAFGAMHRNHSSIVGIDVPYKICGLLAKKELEMFNLVLNKSKDKKVCAIVGGAKVSDKINLLLNLVDRIDYLLIGGGMAFTFLKILQNINIGNSLFDEKGASIVNKIVDKCKKNNVKLVLPIDFVVNNSFSDKGDIYITDNIKDGYMGLDIGPQSVLKFGKFIEQVDIIIWNGPMGVFEMEPFSKGSIGLLNILSNEPNKITIIGGGDTAHLCKKYGYSNKVTFISTGGGSSLKLLETCTLCGLDNMN